MAVRLRRVSCLRVLDLRMKACWFCRFLFLGLPLDGECDSVLGLLDEEVDLSLANTGAVPAAEYVSSVTAPLLSCE